MPVRKSSAVTRTDNEDAAVTDMDMDMDSDLDEGFDPVQAATNFTKVIEAHKKRRYAIRKKIEARYEARVADIAKRTEKRLAEREKKNTAWRKEQLERLMTTAEERAAVQRQAADKVARFYDGTVNLTTLLENAYAGLAADARSAVLAASPGNG